MNKLGAFGGILIVIAQLALGLLQLAAIMAGLEEWFGLHWIIACMIWWVLMMVPILPTVVGIMGAIKGFNWEWWQACLLFLGLQGFVFLVAGTASLTELANQKFKKNPR